LKKKLNEAKQPGSFLVLNGNMPLNVSSVIFCEAGKVSEMLKVRHDPDTWIFIAGRQGAFDAIHVVSNTHIRFVQVTAGKTYSFKLHILHEFMTKLGLAVSPGVHGSPPRGRPPTVQFADNDLQTTTGRLHNYRRFDGAQWYRADCRDNVQYASLDWD